MASSLNAKPGAGSGETGPAETGPAARVRPKRLPLSGRRSRRLRFELRLKLWFVGLAVPTVVLTGGFVFELTRSMGYALGSCGFVGVVWSLATSVLFEWIVRPLQTMSNVVAALREDDFSFRARGAQRGDSLGDLALEINALASTLQRQRIAAVDALSLVEIVMSSMPSPVLAFDPERRLRLLNPAAVAAFELHALKSMGRTAEELELGQVFLDSGAAGSAEDRTLSNSLVSGRWSINRTSFRLHGVPHTLFVLADVSAALRDEERIAWQRLIRVLGHEINNSLTPIKSIAGSLRTQFFLPDREAIDAAALNRSMDRGLSVIEDRADSLNRFLQAYQRLTRLPAPALKPVLLEPLLKQVAQLETRVRVRVVAGLAVTGLAVLGLPVTIAGDADQLQQLFINLVRNAAEATLLRTGDEAPGELEVVVGWSASATQVEVQIVDDGEGLLNETNLFVPFYTTKPGGTGIGLVLAQQIAAAHNGSIRLSNRMGRMGCVAEVSLPVYGNGDAAS